MFKERSKISLRSTILIYSSKHERANLLQVIFWQNPTQFPSLLSPVYAGLILSPQHPEPPAS